MEIFVHTMLEFNHEKFCSNNLTTNKILLHNLVRLGNRDDDVGDGARGCCAIGRGGVESGEMA